jgi:hypothetical protein
LVERWTFNPTAAGSSPSSGVKYFFNVSGSRPNFRLNENI